MEAVLRGPNQPEAAAVLPYPVRPFVFAAPKILIFLASAFVLAEHHQEGDRTKVRVQVCLVP